ncbi:unnamed protein product [Lupinus luteus]|uniref:Ataxin-10 domain-containing protein n=1 Tax=Lupinus luteus TaxID=3873 RepID=A0AAV1Y5V3_LUPLU
MGNVEYAISENTLELLYAASNTVNFEKSLEILIEISKSNVGRHDFASERVLYAVPSILYSLTNASHNQHHHIISLCFKLLRNLCAGEIANQNSFLELNGVTVVSNILRSEAVSSSPDKGLIRWGIQVLANVSLAGKQHQHAVWEELYPIGFVSLAKLRSKETCDPLCMVIYTCCDGNPELFRDISSDGGWPLMAEIVRTASSATSFGEDWLKLLLSRICLEESQLPVLFSKLQFVDIPEGEDTDSTVDHHSSEQAFLLQILSEIVNERIRDITISIDVALFLFGVFKKSVGILEHAVRGKSGLPSGSAAVDVLGYSLTILRDICAQDSVGDDRDNAEDVVDQCVTDDDNPFLREWGIWTMRNMLEGNTENQRIVSELKLQGSADVPEISALGLQVEVDQRTGRAKLVNIPSNERS